MSPLASRPSAVVSELPNYTCQLVTKEVALLPFALKRARAPKSSGARVVPDGLPVMFSPPASILPSGWIRTAWAPWTLALNTGKVVVATPPLPKPVSTVPLALSRTTTNEELVPFADVASPTKTILSSDCTARRGSKLEMPVSGSAADPPSPNDVSLAPFGRNRTSPEPGLVPIAITISPLDCNAAADGLPTVPDTMPPWPKVPSRAPAVPADAVPA